MKDFELDIRYDEYMQEVNISAKRYDDWCSYMNIKNINDLLNAIADYVKELQKEIKEKGE